MISLILPSRGRAESLVESVHSLVDNADEPERVEILIAADPDDEATLAVRAELPWQAAMWEAPQRFGYSQLHRYVNWLAGEATGDWLMMWNDDARMHTEGWDTIVMEQDVEQMPVLWPAVNHSQGGNLFPIWPQRWYHNLGYVSMSPNIDVWVSEIARRLGVERQIPVQVFHDRADVTGGHEDETYREGRAAMGPWNDPGYDSAANRMERTRAVRTIGWLYGRP